METLIQKHLEAIKCLQLKKEVTQVQKSILSLSYSHQENTAAKQITELFALLQRFGSVFLKGGPSAKRKKSICQIWDFTKRHKYDVRMISCLSSGKSYKPSNEFFRIAYRYVQEFLGLSQQRNYSIQCNFEGPVTTNHLSSIQRVTIIFNINISCDSINYASNSMPPKKL